MKIKRIIRNYGMKAGIVAAMASPLAINTSCDEETTALVFDIIDELISMMGYTPNADDVNDESVLDDHTNDGTEIPSSKLWTAYAPPVGNQGSYGTCVAWATGYGLKTTLNRIDGKIANSSSESNQCSPVDLWHLMRTKETNTTAAKCEGSSFDPAFRVMKQYGLKSMADKPFKNQKMSCDPSSNVAMGNTSNKLGDYRVVAYTKELSGTSDYGMTPKNIKYNLTKGPLVVGAKLGERFMKWSNSNVITADDPDSYNGGHAYHAMMVVGYDDSKSAFRIQNSWGASDWGDNGYIWVGYNFFCSNFAFGVWSASNDANFYAGSALRGGSGNDLAVTVESDVENGDGTRTMTYTVKNVGKLSVDMEECNTALAIYKKKHFHEKAILANVKGDGTLGVGESKTFTIDYKIPQCDANGTMISGEYNLFLSLDAKDSLADEDLSSNFAFVTGAGNKPFEVVGGRIDGKTYALHEDLGNKNIGDYHGVELFKRLAKELGK